jgi:hypothetical protein
MFKKWCKSEMCWIDLKCLSMFCGWDLNYANCLRTCHIETGYVLWRNYVLNDFKVFDKCWVCLILRELVLVAAWFYSMTQ